MSSHQKKLSKEINNFYNSFQDLKSTGDNKKFFEQSKGYKSDRNRIHKEILQKYDDLFAVVQSIRKLSVLGIQSVDLSVLKNGLDFTDSLKRYNALNSLMIKYIDVFDEIICLIENGFPDGAMQRWRTFLEYSIIILFILEQGEEVAEAYRDNFYNSIKDNLRHRSNFAWANAATCLKEEKQITIRKLLENIKGIDPKFKKMYQDLYKLTSQSIHGSSFGINLSFNDFISTDINDLHTKNGDYYAGSIDTVISNTMNLLYQTFKVYFDPFPAAGLNMKALWMDLFNEYIKVYKSHFVRV